MQILRKRIDEAEKKEIIGFLGLDAILGKEKELEGLLKRKFLKRNDYLNLLKNEFLNDDDIDLEEKEEYFCLLESLDNILLHDLNNHFYEVVFLKELIELYGNEKEINSIIEESVLKYIEDLKEEELDSVSKRVLYSKFYGGFKTIVKLHTTKNVKINSTIETDITYAIFHDETKYIKIGKTSNIKSRIKQLQTGIPSKIKYKILGNGNLELKLHKKFKDKRIHGEWFDLTLEEILLEVKA